MKTRIKQWILFIVIGLCVGWVNISHAQTETWWAWTYDDRNGEMIWLDSNGFTRKSVILPKPTGYETYGYTYQVAVAPTGDRVAYTLAGQNGEVVLAVYHLMNDYVMMTYSLPVPLGGGYVENNLNYNAMPHIFTSDGRYLSFSYAINGTWGMYVFDTQTNGVAMYSLFNTSPNAPIMNTFEMPIPIYIFNGTLFFTIHNIGGHGSTTQNSYVVNYLTGAISQIPYLPTHASIELRLGEVIYASLDNRFHDRTSDMTIGFHLNSVQVYAPSMANNPFPFYVDEVNTIDSAYFIQNGELVMLRVTEIDGDSDGSYVVIDRRGNRHGILPYHRMWLYPVFSIGEGFVFSATTDELVAYFPQIQPRNSTAVIVVETINGIDGNIGRIVYTGIAGTSARVVWASDITNRVVPNPNSWAEIFPIAVGNPPVMPPSISGLYIGAQARVTLEGDGLNVRQTPSVNGTQLGQLQALEGVSVIDGPQFVDNLIWWQIDNGILRGWVAEGNGNELWLEVYTGTLPPHPVPVTPVISNNPPTGITALFVPIENALILNADLRTNNGIIPVYFEWSIGAGASRYSLELQVCNGATCDWVIALYTPDTFYTIDMTAYAFGTYRWRIVSLDANDTTITATEWRYFTYSN